MVCPDFYHQLPRSIRDACAAQQLARDEREAGAGREEHEPVRSFVLRATGADTFEGRAWSGRRAIALRCRME